MSEWHFASGVVSLFAALVLCLIVLDHRINEGVIIKFGLVGMIFSLLTTFALTINESASGEAYWRASFVLRASVLLVCVGLIARARAYARRLRDAIDIPCDADPNEGATRAILRTIAEPARDLAALLNADSSPAPLKSAKRRRSDKFWPEL